MDYTFTCERFDIRRTLFCGQAFRWKELDGRFCGIAGGRYAEYPTTATALILFTA